MERRIAAHLVKPEAVARLRSQLAEAGAPVSNDVRQILVDAVTKLGPATYADVKFRPAGVGEGDRLEIIHAPLVHKVRTPRFLNGRPTFFPYMEPEQDWEVARPSFEVLRLTNGTVRLIPDAPVAFDAEGTAIDNFSSDYARLLYFYDYPSLDPSSIVRDLPGTALVLIDDVWDLNYCHWIADWLPRLTALRGDLRDTYVIVSPIHSEFQLETLAACGVEADRVVPLQPWTSARARELIMPPNISDPRHPACKGAPWATGMLRQAFAGSAGEDTGASAAKFYLSRADAHSRRVVNEADLETLLSQYGYSSLTLSGRTVAEQAKLFRSASHIIGMHGAGLTNIIFSNPGAQLIEIFAATYGTPAFWVLAAATGKSYATYIADRVIAGPHSQLDGVNIDITAFERQVLIPMHGGPSTSPVLSPPGVSA